MVSWWVRDEGGVKRQGGAGSNDRGAAGYLFYSGRQRSIGFTIPMGQDSLVLPLSGCSGAEKHACLDILEVKPSFVFESACPLKPLNPDYETHTLASTSASGF